MTKRRDKNQGCLGFLLNLFNSNPSSSQKSPLNKYGAPLSEPEIPAPLPFRVRDDFMSLAEQSFYLVIKEMMGSHLTICPKVGLAEIFFVLRPNENHSEYNRINRKHVDFLICEPKTMKPLFAIELDDKSHQRPDRIERDDFVNQVFSDSGLPLIHVPVRTSYNTAELGVVFKRALHKDKSSADTSLPDAAPQAAAIQAPVAQTQAGPPLCPKCGIPMVVRKAQKGDQAGRLFYGCSNYPKCRVVMPHGN